MDTSKSERKKHKKSIKEKKSRKTKEIKVESDSDSGEGGALKINSDDEIFLVQCSKSIDVQKLVSAKFKFYDESLYTDNEIECKQESYKEKKFVTLLTGRSYGDKTLSFIPAGKIIIREKIDVKPVDEVDSKEISPKKKSSVIPMPENLQIRHPLLGFDYKDKLQLDESVLEKLQEAANISIKKSPKRKIKKEKLIKMEVDEENEFIKVEKSKSPKKRSKSEIEPKCEYESPVKKSKKIKKENNGDVSMELDWISNL